MTLGGIAGHSGHQHLGCRALTQINMGAKIPGIHLTPDGGRHHGHQHRPWLQKGHRPTHGPWLQIKPELSMALGNSLGQSDQENPCCGVTLGHLLSHMRQP